MFCVCALLYVLVGDGFPESLKDINYFLTQATCKLTVLRFN